MSISQSFLLLASCLGLTISALAVPDKPNILWITSEDNAAHWMGCYGNTQAKTPRIDALAKKGNLFLHAYSNAPVCAVARSTILNGAYAVSQGTQHMRSRHPIPQSFKPYVSYFRELGYYCTNQYKTDYNFEGNDRALWNDCSDKAHYRKRAQGQPFFAVINTTTTHESSLFPEKRGTEPRRLKASEINVPPYLPDLPEVRADFAVYHDKITEMDSEVGQYLDELKKAGLAEDTIVFYYGDHGGVTPRGKRYLKETGVQIPLVVYVPEKWKHLSPFKPGEVVEEPVAFVDLAPTVLSLIGLEKPAAMQGRPFLGKHRVEAPKDDMVFLYADRFDEVYGMRRGITDGRWKYIRRFTPQLPAAPYSFYQFSMPSWVAYRKAWQEGKLTGVHKELWEKPQAVEELFDLKADPWEVKNLAVDPAHAGKLAEMRGRLKAKMAETKDTGLVPEPMWATLAGKGPIASFVGGEEFDYSGVLDLAFLASGAGKDDLAALIEATTSEDSVKRYWALQGLQIVGDKAGADAAIVALNDEVSANRVTAAEALCVMGREKQGKAAMLKELKTETHDYSIQYLLNAIVRVGAVGDIPKDWPEKALKSARSRHSGGYVRSYAEMIRDGILVAESPPELSKDSNTFIAIKDFDEIEGGSVPYYQDKKNDALAIRANIVEHRDKFARASTTFEGATGDYDVAITTLTEEDGESIYRLLINDKVAGTLTNPRIGPGSDRDMQPFVHTWKGIKIGRGDSIGVESKSATNGEIPEGDGTAWARGRWRQLEVIPSVAWLKPPTGRLAIVIDGNSPDPDDIGATGVMFALLNRGGLNDRLVHLSHSCDLKPPIDRISKEDELRRQKFLHQLCLDGIKYFGPFENLERPINCRTEQDAAVNDLVRAINASSAQNPLWIIEAGEPDIIGFALKEADPAMMEHVHVVSHHPANDDSGDFFEWAEILDFGVKEHQIGDQNVLLQTPKHPWDWAKDHSEPGIAWIWELLDYAEKDGVVKFQTNKFDCSDAGMIYWWMSGADQGGNKLATTKDIKAILQKD